MVTKDKDGGQSPGATEREVGALWLEVLQLSEPPCAEDNFFAVGGDSMSMALLEIRIQEEWALELPAGTLMSAPTLRELCRVIDEHRQRLQHRSESAHVAAG